MGIAGRTRKCLRGTTEYGMMSSFMAKPLQYQSPSISRGLSAPSRFANYGCGSKLYLVMRACRVGGPLLLLSQFPRNGIYFGPSRDRKGAPDAGLVDSA